jgi:predicted dehydrogenase
LLKIGVVGAGHIAKHRHIPIFLKINGVTVQAICDAQESTARSVAERFGVKNYYTTISEMLKENLDIVDITTPPQTHIAVGVEAMEAGCHVVVEKPLAMTVEDVNKMYDVSRRNDVTLCVVHQNIFNPAVQKARRLVEGGYVGDLISVESGTLVRKENYMCVNANHWCHKLPGGIFFEVLPHPVYLLQIFLKELEPAFALTKKLGDYAWMKADEARILLNAHNGIGSIVASCNSPYHGDTLNIFGTKLGLQVDLWGRSVIKYKPKTENPVSVGKANLSLAGQFLGLLGTTVSNALVATFRGERVSAHFGFLREYINSIKNGGNLPVSEEEAREEVRIVERICELIDNSLSDGSG